MQKKSRGYQKLSPFDKMAMCQLPLSVFFFLTFRFKCVISRIEGPYLHYVNYEIPDQPAPHEEIKIYKVAFGNKEHTNKNRRLGFLKSEHSRFYWRKVKTQVRLPMFRAIWNFSIGIKRRVADGLPPNWVPGFEQRIDETILNSVLNEV